jgi:hypothetical protein
VIVTDPAARAVIIPVALTLATMGFEELHVALEGRSFFDPSEYTPVAVICCVSPAAIAPSGLPTEMKTRLTLGSVPLLQALRSIITPSRNAIPNARKHIVDNPFEPTAMGRIVIGFNSFFLGFFPARQKLRTSYLRECCHKDIAGQDSTLKESL